MAPRLKKILQQSLTSKEGGFLNWGALGVGMAHFVISVVHFLKISSMLNQKNSHEKQDLFKKIFKTLFSFFNVMASSGLYSSIYITVYSPN